MPAEPAWLNGWPRIGLTGVLIGTGVHCVGCGRFHGATSVIFDDDWNPPTDDPAYPFEQDNCPVCRTSEPFSPLFDVRVSDIRRGQEWLLDGAWVRVVNVVVRHPDDRVAITYEQDGEQMNTRKHCGIERAAVR